jgi:hypothetical protein
MEDRGEEEQQKKYHNDDDRDDCDQKGSRAPLGGTARGLAGD